MRLGRVDEGLRLVDEALVAATAGDLSPHRHGHRLLQYHRVLLGRYELRHVREWTAR